MRTFWILLWHSRNPPLLENRQVPHPGTALGKMSGFLVKCSHLPYFNDYFFSAHVITIRVRGFFAVKVCACVPSPPTSAFIV